MGCINDKNLKTNRIKKHNFQKKYHHSFNPIIQIAKQWDIDIIMQRWHDNQLDVICAKLGPKIQKITRQQFLKLLYALNNFSTQSQENFYRLFNFQENTNLSINNFMIAQIIILKSDDYELLADIFFFVYSSALNKDTINTADYNLFCKEFKEYQLQFMHQTVKPLKDQNGQIVIDKKLFREIFQQYDIKSIKKLFRFNVKEEERNLQKFLASTGIDRTYQAQVFMVDFGWFLKWKNYMEYKYGIKISIKQNSKNLGGEKRSFLESTLKKNWKWQKTGQKLESQAEDDFMQPVNNERIQGQQVNELRQGLVEFSDFISVPAQVWNQIRIIYGGGPTIDKPYPHFYNKRIILTLLDQQKCQFRPGFWKAMVYDPNQNFSEIYLKRQQKYFLKQSVQDMVAFYKHPGELQWKKIQDISTKLSNFPFQYKSYLVYVKKSSAQNFQQKFNLTEVKGKKQIKQRIKNYGNLLTFQHQSILQQGHVGSIYSKFVVLYLKDAKGQYLKIQSKISDLQKLNPSVLQDNILQGFAGLQNIGNTCYVNAPLQCLLKTPFFDQYLDSVNLGKLRNDMVTYQLQKIYQQSKNSRNCISMSSFKKKFDEKYSFFEGSAQHDAQQFLLLLLDKLSQEQPRQSLMGNEGQAKKNKKIHTFFSGKTAADTQCLKCHNKGHTEQSFFTYSLSLPIINQVLFSFYYVDQNFKVKKYGLTITRESGIGEVVKMISNELEIDEQKLMIMSVSEGQWMNDIQKINVSYKIAKLQSFDSVIVCYGIKNSITPQYEDIYEGIKKNSVKLQIRNRVFDPKTKSYKAIHFPFFVQINHQTTGKTLTYSIIDKIKKFFNDQDYHNLKEFEEELENQYMRLIEVTEKEKSQLNSTKKSGGGLENSRQKIKNFPFTIRYLKNQDGLRSICWFCKKRIDFKGGQADLKTDCQECQFPENDRLYQNRTFMKGFSNLVLSIDWKSQSFSKDWNIEQTKSYEEAKYKQMCRKNNLQKLLRESSQQQQKIELKCQRTECKHVFAIRKQKIIEAPNILIIHLKRFYFKNSTFHKLRNKVVIPQQFELPGFSDNYQLYGNVVHYGSGSGKGGHYINYVKVNGRWYRCDDEKVHFTKEPDEHLNPNAYLLFYKRKKIDRSWSFFGI